MFGKKKTDAVTESVTETVTKEGGKGRPTPSRKEAEAAARERARAGLDKKAAAKLHRERRRAENAKIREGMRTGDERYLPARDQGPVKRFIRDYVDSRLNVIELVLPMLVLSWIFTTFGNETMFGIGNGLFFAVFVLTIVDGFLLTRRVKKEVSQRFPDEDQRGVTSYTMLRALQLRPLRLPKARVGLGGKPKAPK